MDGRPNPLYHAEGHYWLPLECQIEGYQHQDPPSQCKLAIPISLIEYLVQLGASSNSPKLQSTCDACTIAFYYLLHISEYTSHCCNDCHHTQQFQMCDITFYDHTHTTIPSTAPLPTLLTTTKATMRITNQKNGARRTIISHNTSNTVACPVHALACHVHHILSHPLGSTQDIINTYYSSATKTLCCLWAGDISHILKATVIAIGLDKKGFPPSSISSHSL